MTSIDRLDAHILAALTDNARIGVAELAVVFGVSRNTIQTRIRRLTDSGVLIGFRPIIDLPSVGMPVQALIRLELDQRKMPRIIDELRSVPQVLEVRIQAGREDLSIEVAVDSLEALQELTTVVVALDGVRKTTSSFAVSTPIPYRIQPLLDHLTADAGWGRSTPAAD